ncbi:MAG: alpha/beta hydrolase [Solirubrobacteraceae bacterium]|nr:alpha/beta hydrolase [Solirubrobacteraceae bacterium]
MTASGPTTITFPSGDAECVGDLWLPAGTSPEQPLPIVILGHGLGATRGMGLGRYAERFAQAGIAALAFDYRHFGDSGGEPRQLLSIPRQREDWQSAIAWARSHAAIDPGRVAIWGSSFGGGHVLWVAARDHSLAAVIAQCPFTDGLASSMTLGPKSTVKVTSAAIADQLGALLGRPPRTVALAGPAGSAALMTAPDALPGYERLNEEGGDATGEVAARIALTLSLDRPGRGAGRIESPTLAIVCEPDTVAPDRATLRHLQRAANPAIEVRQVPWGHFDIYFGEPFEQLVAEQTHFLQVHLGLTPGPAPLAAEEATP